MMPPTDPGPVTVGLVGWAVAMGALVLLRGPRHAGPHLRWFAAALPLALVLLLPLLVGLLVNGGSDVWTINRLAPPYALRQGHNLYGQGPCGPMLSWMYGPVGMLAYLPLTLVRAPRAVVVGGEALALLFTLLPLVVALVSVALRVHRRVGPRGHPWLFAGGLLLALLAAVVASPPLRYVGTRAHVDSVTLALGGLAALLALRPAGWRRDLVLALLLAGAVWTKQTMAFVAAGICLFALLRDGLWPAALRLAGLTALSCLALLGLFVARFGGAGMAEIMMHRPASLGWWSHVSDGDLDRGLSHLHLNLGLLAAELGRRGAELLLDLLPLLLLGLLALWWGRSLRPVDAASPAAGWRRLRARLQRSPWSLPALLALLLTPLCIVARAKIGGDVNSLAPVVHLALLALVLLLGQLYGRLAAPGGYPSHQRERFFAAGVLVLLLLALALVVPVDPVDNPRLPGVALLVAAVLLCWGAARMVHWPRSWQRALARGAGLLLVGTAALAPVDAALCFARQQLHQLDGSWIVRAVRFARSHPGGAYFPELPLVHLLLRQPVPYSAIELADRAIVQAPVRLRCVRRGVADHPRFVVLMDDHFLRSWARTSALVQTFFPEYRRLPQSPDTSGFVVYARPPSNAVP